MLSRRAADSRHMRVVAKLICAAVLVLAIVAGDAAAASPPGMPPKGKVLLGVGGVASDPVRFGALTRQQHRIHVVSFGWGQGVGWGGSLNDWLAKAAAGDYRLMYHLTTTNASGRELITPGAIAAGKGDGALIAASDTFNSSGQIVYVRPMGEMNGHWNVWSAYNANGSRRNAAHSTANFRNAFRRISLIMRGGSVASINARLTALKLRPLATSRTELPRSGRVAIVWNPQAEGAPNLPGNMPRAYWPGGNYVDYVANDLYSIRGRAAWRQQEAFFRDFPRKPFMLAEWAPWGTDEPSFITAMFAWAKARPRVVAVIYFNGTRSGVFTLSRKPRSLAAYRRAVRATRFRCSTGCGA